MAIPAFFGGASLIASKVASESRSAPMMNDVSEIDLDNQGVRIAPRRHVLPCPDIDLPKSLVPSAPSSYHRRSIHRRALRPFHGLAKISIVVLRKYNSPGLAKNPYCSANGICHRYSLQLPTDVVVSEKHPFSVPRTQTGASTNTVGPDEHRRIVVTHLDIKQFART